MHECDSQEHSSWERVGDAQVASSLQKTLYSLWKNSHNDSDGKDHEHKSNFQVGSFQDLGLFVLILLFLVLEVLIMVFVIMAEIVVGMCCDCLFILVSYQYTRDLLNTWHLIFSDLY